MVSCRKEEPKVLHSEEERFMCFVLFLMGQIPKSFAAVGSKRNGRKSSKLTVIYLNVAVTILYVVQSRTESYLKQNY